MEKILVLSSNPIDKSEQVNVKFTPVFGDLCNLLEGDIILTKVKVNGEYEHYGSYNGRMSKLIRDEKGCRTGYLIYSIDERIIEKVNAHLRKVIKF